MTMPRNYNSEVGFANVDATVIAAQAVPASMFLEVIQTEFETGKAQSSADPSIMMRGLELIANQSVLDWKGVTLASGMFMLTSVQRGLKARENAEYQNFRLVEDMGVSNESFADRMKQRLGRGAALVGAYAVGTRLNLPVNAVGASVIAAGAVGYGAFQARRMGWKMFGRRQPNQG